MDSGIYESEEETAKREEVLRRLDEVIRSFDILFCRHYVCITTSPFKVFISLDIIRAHIGVALTVVSY